MLDPERYWPVDQDALAARFVEVTIQLNDMRRQYKEALVSQRQTYYHTFTMSSATSVAAKEREADLASLTEWLVVEDTRCELVELKNERKLLLRLMDVNDARRER